MEAFIPRSLLLRGAAAVPRQSGTMEPKGSLEMEDLTTYKKRKTSDLEEVSASLHSSNNGIVKKKSKKHTEREENGILSNQGGNESKHDNSAKKKSMKKKQQQDEEVVHNGTLKESDEKEANGFENGSDCNTKKKKKNKKKREEEVHNEDVEEETGNCENLNDITHNSVGKKKKKKKKKKEKAREEEAVCDNAIKGIAKKQLKKMEHDQSNGKEALQKDRSTDSAGNRQMEVSVSGRDSKDPKFKALESFKVESVRDDVMECCMKFEKPSPIQGHAWPFLLCGRDFIGIAATGSGKTLAFGVPALMHVLKKKEVSSKAFNPICLVMSPTRELAQQIAAVLTEAGSKCGVKVACVYGGASKGPQKAALKAGASIVVATPGRLQDLLGEGICTLRDVTFLVLDEADRMVDEGFAPVIREIVAQTHKNRQTVMFSATWPAAVDQIAKEFIIDSNPVKVTVGSADLSANHDVTQIVEVLEEGAKEARLDSLLNEYHKTRRNRILVFVLYKKEATRIEAFLQRRGWKVVAVHGDKGQQDRTRAVEAFKDGSHPLLIATDVASRGLDIPDVEYVINLSFPLTTEDYVHRIGRTGRAGKKGIAHTLFTHTDKARAGELINVLREAGQVVPDELLRFGTHVKKKESKLYGAHFKEISADAPKATKITFGDSDDD